MHPTSQRLLAWYDSQGRDLPWRRDPTPYHTWLSEIMLQQTRVETAIPYYERFLERWPSVGDLARAPIEEILGAWSGLGYYRRARNLHRAATQVHQRGGFPQTLVELRALAGVGEYTAAAIASIALGQDVLAVDGNLRRVVARLAAIQRPVATGEGDREVRRWLEARLPAGRAGAFNQALMDLGATICMPRSPRCDACPLAQDCQARAAGCQGELPVVPRRRPPRAVRAVALLATLEGALLLVQRPPEGLLAGLWGPPDRVLAPGESPSRAASVLLAGLADAPADPPRSVGSLEHVFTHQRWQVEAFAVQLPAAWDAPTARWWRHGSSRHPPLSRLAERILELHQAVAQ
jgi:A/G-specific adenine glycosylase